jgi:tRNA modification GTPase
VRSLAPSTYTREDVAELHTIGSPPLVREALAALVDAGARLALPGEFTRRAFRNGRIDLAQAEAVLALVHAQSEAERRCASDSLAGGLGGDVRRATDAIASLLALVEAALDFSDQDIEIASDADVLARLESIEGDVERIGRAEGRQPAGDERPRVVLCGAANAGKSSLLNALVGRERSIVTEVAGTTLDVVEADLSLGGRRVTLVDTPGFLGRDVGALDAEAARRARGEIEAAAACVLLADASGSRGDLERALDLGRAALEAAGARCVIEVESKLDLVDAAARRTPPSRVAVSSLTGEGLEAVRDAIAARTEDARSRPALAAAARHRALIDRARGALARGGGALRDGHPLEVVAVDLRDALDALGEIVGAVTTEDLLGRIFSQFCIGK